MTEKNGKLANSYALVNFTNNSIRKEQLCLRLLLQGEVRAGLTWYIFLRYKAHISSDAMSLLSPGSHSVKIPLPFKDSQYDTNILPPSMDDDIRYSCSVTTKPWEINDIAEERAIAVDYFADTQAKEKFKMSYSEIVGEYGIEMKQRTFQRGKHVFVTVNGEVRAVRLRLEQQRRIRIAGLNADESYCTERVVAGMDSPEDKDKWPEQWSMRIPSTIPPSIEITYWNVLALSYSLTVVLVAEDGHEHVHNVPVWIGCTDDHLPPPQPLRTAPKLKPKEQIHPATKPKPQLPDELPEFEVVRNEETHEIPVWVDRYTDHMYS
ncbi:unnamed protein product [Cylicostephanus goldi]|uniref:Arrestin-like N-terminal domain-containing protein n=1 Tax=Cylicostephanus goldi TaxID=71465 RepID=A0A3P6RTQ5_CYLGO|nr:unnamed protein product [Cylicostephanus goldi]